MDGIDCFSDVGLLQFQDGRGGFQGMDVGPIAVAVDTSIYSVDIVGSAERVAQPGIASLLQLQLYTPSVKEHEGGINSQLTGCNDPFPKSLEEFLVEAGQIESGLAVQGQAGSRTFIRHRSVVAIGTEPRSPFCIVPDPQADEVVVLFL